MNLLFPFCVTAASTTAVLVWQEASYQASRPALASGLAFVGTLLVLAILEHWFLVLPLPAELLWKWGLRSRKESEQQRATPRPRAIGKSLPPGNDLGLPLETGSK